MSEHQHRLGAGQQVTAEPHPSGMAKVGHTPADEVALEAEIQAKGLNAPRLTPAHIDATIASEVSGRASELFKGCPGTERLSTLTICVITLRNGFTLVGTSACASPENYDADIGHRIARDNAKQKVWELEGYLLRERLHAAHG